MRAASQSVGVIVETVPGLGMLTAGPSREVGPAEVASAARRGQAFRHRDSRAGRIIRVRRLAF
jgi:hypothetical protein